MSRTRILIGLIIVAVLAGLGYVGYQKYLAPAQGAPTPTSNASLSTTPEAPSVVSAEGKIVPARDATLAFRMAGRVEKISVKEGEAVKEGNVLIQLESADVRAGVAQAQAAVAQAEAAVALAQAQLDQITAGPRPEEIAAAEAQAKAASNAVGQAVAQRDQVAKGATDDAIAAAEAQLAQAQVQRKEAEDAYQRLMDSKMHGWMEEQAILRVNAANEAVAAAQAALDQLKSGASPELVQAYNSAIGVASQQRKAAEAQLALLQAGATKAQVDAAMAQVDQAKAGLEAAKAALAAAQAQLDQATLKAPFAGTIVSLSTEVGEVVTPGAPVLVLVDISKWRMKTNDLSETDVVLVRLGQSVTATLDAFGDQTFHGVVTEIASIAETNRGNTTYAVTIDLDPTDAPLRWGMTAFVDIDVRP
ncbi:MAG: Biotin lipoyl 2 protein [Anaerolineales bacterium]|nr:Biotin lipoyl 2 protein [Anaerolineales bacterium]